MTLRRIATLAMCFLLASCGADALTELVVIVDSELPVPDALDEVSVVVEGVARIPKVATARLDGVDAQTLPLTVGLRPGSSGSPTVTIKASGLRDGTRRVSAEVRTSFLEGRRLVVHIVLRAACVDVICAEMTTCAADGRCASSQVDASTLPTFTGTLPGDLGPADAGVPDLGAGDAGDLGTRADAGQDLGPVCNTTTCVRSACEFAVCAGTECVRTSFGCAAGTQCCGGACVPDGCEDGDPCTLGSCGPTGCVQAPSASACDDGDPCTAGDRCRDFVCAGTGGCDDGIACTIDACAFSAICAHTPSNALCDDGSPCTSDACGPTGCVATPMPDFRRCVSPDPVSENCSYCSAGVCVLGLECLDPCTCRYSSSVEPICRAPFGPFCP